MSWRASSGRDTDLCNRCRKVPDMGAPLYVGPISGAFYCGSCAESVLGQRIDGQKVGSVRDTQITGVSAEMAQGFEALREKASRKWVGERSWTGEDE